MGGSRTLQLTAPKDSTTHRTQEPLPRPGPHTVHSRSTWGFTMTGSWPHLSQGTAGSGSCHIYQVSTPSPPTGVRTRALPWQAELPCWRHSDTIRVTNVQAGEERDPVSCPLGILSACIYLLPSGALPHHSVCETPRQLTKLFTVMEKVLLLSHYQERQTEAHREA